MNEKQLEDLKSLKSLLRCLVVSNPAAMDANTLRREYKAETGINIPFFQYGYRDLVAFLRERCSDIFTFTGMPTNPILTPVITKEIAHIDKFISKQKVPQTKSYKPKRSRTFETPPQHTKNNNSYSWEKAFANKKKNSNQNNYIDIKKEVERQDKTYFTKHDSQDNSFRSNNVKSTVKVQNGIVSSPDVCKQSKQSRDEHLALNFVPESVVIGSAAASESDSGTHMSSSGNNERGHKLLVSNLKKLILENPKGIWSVELQSKYRDRFGVELDYERRGYNCLVSMCRELTGVFSVHRPNQLGDWLLMDCNATPLQEKRNVRQFLLNHHAIQAQEINKKAETDDALPGIDFDPSIYPSDCLHYLESIPALNFPIISQEDRVREVIVAEVADPSHFWFQLRGSEYSGAMEAVMDQMTDYYNSQEGVTRNMAAGAVRVGQYCAANFEGDWHRSVIVQILTKGMVKVRHIDYGTVESVSSDDLRYLLRVWSYLPAQALRGQLAHVAPPLTAARWPHSTARHFLNMVREKALIADILHVDPEEQIVSMILVDTSSSEDIFINDELVTSGLAEPFDEEELSFDDMPVDFFLPTFDAFENGRAFNYGEKMALLNKGICPEELQDPTGVCGKPRKCRTEYLLHRRCEEPGNSDLGSSLESVHCPDDDVSELVPTIEEEPLQAFLPLSSSLNEAELGYNQRPGSALSASFPLAPQYCMAPNQMNMLENNPTLYPSQHRIFSSHVPLQLPCNANTVMMPYYAVHSYASPVGSPILPSSPNPYSMMPPFAYCPHFNTNMEQMQSPMPNSMPNTNTPRKITKNQCQGSYLNENVSPPNVNLYPTLPPAWSSHENQKQPKLQSETEISEAKPFLSNLMPYHVLSETAPNFSPHSYNTTPSKSTDNSHQGNNAHSGFPNGSGYETNKNQSISSSGQYVIPQKRNKNSSTNLTTELANCNLASGPPTASSSPSANTAGNNFDFNAPPVQLSSLDLVVLQALISTNPALASDFLANIKAKNNVSGTKQHTANTAVPETLCPDINGISSSEVAIPPTTYTPCLPAAAVEPATVTVGSQITLVKPPGFDIGDEEKSEFWSKLLLANKGDSKG